MARAAWRGGEAAHGGERHNQQSQLLKLSILELLGEVFKLATVKVPRQTNGILPLETGTQAQCSLQTTRQVECICRAKNHSLGPQGPVSWSAFLTFHLVSLFLFFNSDISIYFLFYFLFIFLFSTFFLLFKYSCLHFPPPTTPRPLHQPSPLPTLPLRSLKQ